MNNRKHQEQEIKKRVGLNTYQNNQKEPNKPAPPKKDDDSKRSGDNSNPPND